MAGKWREYTSYCFFYYSHSCFISVNNHLTSMKTMFNVSNTIINSCSTPKLWPVARQLSEVENLERSHFRALHKLMQSEATASSLDSRQQRHTSKIFSSFRSHSHLTLLRARGSKLDKIGQLGKTHHTTDSVSYSNS